jgi:hypothetical protein
MIESTIVTVLSADTTLKSFISEYTIPGTSQKIPAIFNKIAPEGATKPYIVFKIEENKTNSIAVAEFAIYFDFWDYGQSWIKVSRAAEAVKNILDYKIFEHENYSKIRPLFFSGGSVEEEDSRVIHYNQLFSARAFRKKWVEQLNN